MNNTTVTLGYHRLHPQAFVPKYATEDSACFDLCACLPTGYRTIDIWSVNGSASKSMAFVDEVQGNQDASFILYPGDRALIPTQLVLDIPRGYSVRLHMRSGLAIKGGLMLSNCEGVIDSDYTNQLMIPITNTSKVNVRIHHGDRICQGEIVEKISTDFIERTEPIQNKTNRSGGFGSTGKA